MKEIYALIDLVPIPILLIILTLGYLLLTYKLKGGEKHYGKRKNKEST